MAANPRSPRARITPPKPVASAQAPWTNTIVGLSAAIVVTAPFVDGLTGAATVPPRRRACRCVALEHLPVPQAPRVERSLTSAQAPGFRRWERDRLMQLWQIGVMGGVMLKDGAGLRVVTGLDPENGTTGAFSHPPRGRAVRRTWWRAAVETACKRAVSSGRGFTRFGCQPKEQSTMTLFRARSRRASSWSSSWSTNSFEIPRAWTGAVSPRR